MPEGLRVSSIQTTAGRARTSVAKAPTGFHPKQQRAAGPFEARRPPSAASVPEAAAVLGGGEEGSDHLGLLVVAAELVELAQPELVAGQVGVGRLVRVSAQ